jgi:hypothetical protein
MAAAAVALLAPSGASAQIPDLQLPGNLPHQLTDFGVAMRDAIRKKLGDCTQPVGGILVCGHKDQYRIDRNVFAAERGHGSDSEYDRYLEAKAHQRNTGQD